MVLVFFHFFIPFTTSFRHCVIFSLLLICFYVYHLEIQVLGNLALPVQSTYLMYTTKNPSVDLELILVHQFYRILCLDASSAL